MSARADQTRQGVVTLALVFEGGLVLVAVVLGWLFGQPTLVLIDWTLGGVWWGLVAAVPLLTLLLLITWWPIGPLEELDKLVEQKLVPLFRACTLLELLLISALAGLGEELLFRGFVQGGLERATGSVPIALVAASLLFGLAHPITPAYAVLAGLIGLYLGWLWLATDNLLVPIVTHGAYDFAALVFLIHTAEMPPAGNPPPGEQHGEEWSI